MSAKHVKDLLYKFLDDLTDDTSNSDLYKDKLKNMSDKQISSWVAKLVSGEERVTVTAPNFGKPKITIETTKKVSKKYGIKLYHFLTIKSNDKDIPDTKTLEPQLVNITQITRLSQMINNSMKMPKTDSKRDSLSGQVVGDSEGISLSNNEISILTGVGLGSAVKEVFSVKGGDQGAYSAYSASLYSTGEVSLAEIAPYATAPGSVNVTKNYLKSLLIGTDL